MTSISRLRCFVQPWLSFTPSAKCTEGLWRRQLCTSPHMSGLSATATSLPHKDMSAAFTVRLAGVNALAVPPKSLQWASIPTQPSNESMHITSLLSLLSLEPAISDRAIRLPPAMGRRPPLVPPPLPPALLPQSSTAVASIVEPAQQRSPALLPEHPSQGRIIKRCITMLIIRRKKMKKHKRKKERKRNRVSHEHRILMDVMRREKTFQTEQLALLRAADAFDAEQHVRQILERVNFRPVPKFYCGKRLPEAEVLKLMRKRGQKFTGSDY